jgi:anti-anti-sigma factor
MIGDVEEGALRHTLERDRAGVVRLALRGTLDAASAPAAREALARAEGMEGAALALDVRDLHLGDAEGVRVLVDADARARAAGRRLALVGSRAELMQGLSRLGVAAAFEVVATPEAVAAPHERAGR